jgi:DNA polymerase-3 subunit alpha
MDFLERVDIRSVGKKPIELLIKTGAFDNLGQSRPLLLSNMENAINYVEKKKEANQYGAISLFEDAGIKEFVDFVFVDTPDWTPLEKLAVEKELLGFYISGHPLDQFKTTINKCTNFKTSEVARVQPGKNYTIIGMIKEIRTIITKKGDPMAFAKLEDFDGIIDLTFFTKQWEKYSSLIIPDAVVALTGKIDTSRGAPSFIVDEVLNPNELQEKSIQEVHIKLKTGVTSEQQIRKLQDFLFGIEGNCFVYFHIDILGKSYTLKASPSTKISSSDEVLEDISTIPCVMEVWKS